MRKLVEMHGGTVWAESRGLGQGSTFSVRLPLAAQEQVENATIVARPLPVPVPFRILVVDDNHDAAESLAMLLQLSNHETVTAYNGPQAVDVARRLRPRAVFLDIGLPGMSGYQVARTLRGDPIRHDPGRADGRGGDRQQEARAGRLRLPPHLTGGAGPGAGTAGTHGASPERCGPAR